MLAALCACARHHPGGRAGDNSGANAAESGGGRRSGTKPVDGPACLATEIVAEIADPLPVLNADVLFVIDDAQEMAEEQAALARQFPRFVDRMIGPDGLPISSLHLAVVSTDLGLANVPGIQACSGLGDDGLFLHAPRTGRQGCEPGYPPFLDYALKSDRKKAATDLGCIAAIGTDGCGFEQPLEAGLKALWPASDARVTFVAASGAGVGHGDGDNAGFLRRSADDTGLLAVIVVSNEDDCSSRELRHFTPSQFLDPDDPSDAELLQQGLNTRCHFNPQELFEVSRYVRGFKALHPFNEQSVIFGALVGVPPDAIGGRPDPTAAEADPAVDERYFQALLAHPAMQEVVDDVGTPDPADDMIKPSCASGPSGLAMPPRRIVQVAQGFGINGVVGTVCSDDYSPFFDDLMSRMEHAIGAGGLACLPRPIARNADGTIDCDVYWELPAATDAREGIPSSCASAAFPFLSPPPVGEPTITNAGGPRCRVTQLPVQTAADGTAAAVAADQDGAEIEDGWYYDDFSHGTLSGCDTAPKQRISFSEGAAPPAGITIKLQCLVAEAPLADDAGSGNPILPQPPTEIEAAPPPASNLACSAGTHSSDSSKVGDPCRVTAAESGFDPREVWLEVGTPQCGGGACAVDHLGGVPQPCKSTRDMSCATAEETAAHVYCTCRCDAPEGFEQCACPDGFSCTHVLTQGGDDIRGGYCLRAR